MRRRTRPSYVASAGLVRGVDAEPETHAPDAAGIGSVDGDHVDAEPETYAPGHSLFTASRLNG